MDQNGTPRYAALRGVGTEFVGEASGSDKNYSFCIPAEEKCCEVHLFESAIDLLSYATEQKLDGGNWRETHLLSLAGVYQPAKEIEKSKVPAALITCLLLVTGILCLVSTAVAGCMPWREAVNRTAPFADVLVGLTGVPAVRVLFLVTAFVGAVGVMNSTLYSSARMLYGLAQFALVPPKFAKLHPRYATPTRCIWFTAAFVVVTPFTGKLLFLPFINVASLTTIVMWVMTYAAVLTLRRSRPELRRPVSMPGGRVTAVLGAAASVFLAGNILLPMSPGALNGLEYALAALLAALGAGLYLRRDRSVSRQEQETRIFGDLLRR